MEPVPASVAKQAELRRLDGNTAFKKERLGAAIDAYTEMASQRLKREIFLRMTLKEFGSTCKLGRQKAITLCPDVAVYWTNRALCFYKKKNWTRVEEDCRTAIDIDSSSVKAHYMLGLAILEREDYTGGIKELEKALDFVKFVKSAAYMVDDIWQALAKAKYKEWEISSSKRAWQLQKLKDACEKALLEHHFLEDPTPDDEFREISKDVVDQLEILKEVFCKAADDDTPKEIPDYLCCNITLDIFRDPVITPSGVTYERNVLLDHLQKVGKFDPITREPLDTHQLIPNLAMKEAARVYLKKHGWAYRMS